MLNKLKEVKETIVSTIKDIFNKEMLDELAKKSGFVKRSTSKLNGSELIEVLTVHMLDDPEMSYEAMCDAIAQINPVANLKPQSLEERINKQETVNYVKSILEEAISKKISYIKELPYPLFNMFSSVDIRDSTTISLNQKLAGSFKGSGGNASPSAVKVDVVYNIKDCQLKKLVSMKGVTQINPCLRMDHMRQCQAPCKSMTWVTFLLNNLPHGKKMEFII